MNQLTVSLWRDEAWTATLIAKNWLDIIKFVSKDTSPPLFYLLSHIWTRFFGMSEIGLRSFSVFLWFFTAVFAASIARHFWKNKYTTIFVFLFTLLNPFLFQYAFEARMYAILACFSAAATYFFLKKNWPFYILFAVASLYSHHFSLFVIFWHGIWTLIKVIAKKQNLFRSLKPFFIIGLLYLPWLPVMYYQTKMVAVNGFWVGRPVLKDLAELIFKFIVGANKSSWQQLAVIATALLLILRRWSIKDSATWFLLGWFAVPALLVYGLSQVVQPIFYNRYLINLIPALVLIIFSRYRSAPFLSYPFIGLMFLSLFITDYQFFTHPTKPSFRQMAVYIKSTRQPGDSLINWNGAAQHLFESKYYGVYAPIYVPDRILPFYIGTALMEAGDQIFSLPVSSRLGVITSDPIETVKITGYTKVDEKHYDNLVFSWWIPPSPKE